MIAATNGAAFCPACGKIQALADSADYFAYFGLPHKLWLGMDGLEQKFLQLSWKLHPDNFVNGSERERELLRYLACHTDRAISREELLANVWKIDARGVTTRTIDMHVARLREKLRDVNGEPRVLLTVRGKGYMLARSAI